MRRAPGGVQDRHRLANLRNDRTDRLRRRSDSDSPATALLDQLHDGISLVGIEATQLIPHIETGLAAKIEQILGLQVQLARQGVNPDFLLQAELLYSRSPPPQ
jgi:hypothetical protein